MAAENIRKEFSLDHYDSLLVNYGMGKANAYRMLFVNQRRLNKLETELGLAPNSRYSVKKYNSILNEKGLAEADLYREFYQIKNQMVKDLHLLNMGTEEEYDDNVDLDPTSTKVDENSTTDPTATTDPVENPTDTQETETSTVVENPQTTNPVEDPVEEEHPDIEGLRQKYLEVVGKPVANIMKNNAEWIKAKIEEAESAKPEDTKAEENNTDPVETTDPVENNTTEANPSVNDEAKTE